VSSEETGPAGSGASSTGCHALVARRRVLLGGTALVAGGAGAMGPVLRLRGTPAFADRALDVQMLQTSASVENLAVELYEAALELPVIGGERAEPLVRDLFTRTRDQHADHAKACNAALTKLGARSQGNADAALRDLVARARSGATDVSRTLEAAIAVETAAAATYQSNAAALLDTDARRVTAAIGGVEAQHVAALALFAAILREGSPELLRLSPATVEDLPADLATAGLPGSFTATDRARPPAEGAVR
jgi:rubrerythrin